MKTSNHIKIPWKDLSEGIHEFQFNIGNTFFADIEYSEYKEGELEISIELIRKTQIMSLNFLIEGSVNVICDRCLEPFDLDIYFESDLLVKVGTENEEIDDNIISIAENEEILDLTHYVYESIVLSIPFKKVHPDNENDESTCDQKMLAKIKKPTNSKSAKKETDSRWDVLKKLKNNK